MIISHVHLSRDNVDIAPLVKFEIKKKNISSCLARQTTTKQGEGRRGEERVEYVISSNQNVAHSIFIVSKKLLFNYIYDVPSKPGLFLLYIYASFSLDVVIPCVPQKNIIYFTQATSFYRERLEDFTIAGHIGKT